MSWSVSVCHANNGAWWSLLQNWAMVSWYSVKVWIGAFEFFRVICIFSIMVSVPSQLLSCLTCASAKSQIFHDLLFLFCLSNSSYPCSYHESLHDLTDTTLLIHSISSTKNNNKQNKPPSFVLAWSSWQSLAPYALDESNAADPSVEQFFVIEIRSYMFFMFSVENKTVQLKKIWITLLYQLL